MTMTNLEALLVVLFESDVALTVDEITYEIRTKRRWRNYEGQTAGKTVNRDLGQRDGPQYFTQSHRDGRKIRWQIKKRATVAPVVASIRHRYPALFRIDASAEMDGPRQTADSVLEDFVTLPASGSAKSGRIGSPRQLDPLLRQRVEDAAINEVIQHFTEIGYSVDTFEKDNLGWDLEAVLGNETLRLEVKGLSGSAICVELTPNEFQKMNEHRDSYRLCVVTEALTAPTLAVFAFAPNAERWEDQDGRSLILERLIAARFRTT